ncbi:MAG: FtsH protease activity modulator HflK [Halobacteriovoraceae bacterium]|nr:FtsH protease activity modulator HflK [Halobacteriovoraceae bacterium]|tara:strand:- start:211374 stop:212369 length:996 start_codon:yes stop_codon:yes gene_type:complete
MNQGQPDLNYELYKLKQSFNKNKKAFIPLIIALLLAVGFFTSYYTVEPDEEAVVIRLGRYLETTQPGLHFKIPFGVDRVIKVKTKIVHQEEFGFRTQSLDTRRTTYSSRNLDEESLMLTGDLNVAEVQWVVQYQISNPFKFLFKTSEPVRNIRDVSESIMRRVVGDIMVTEVLTTGRVGIAGDAKQLMQEVLDKYNMGVLIRSIKLQDVNPPKKVQASFNDVNAAKQEQEKMINQAEQAYNKVIPEAKGKAKKLVSEAQGYAQAVVNRAEGDADRFSEIYREYIKAPEITQKRLYLETMEELFSRMEDVVIIDSKVKGLLPVFGKGITSEK